MGSVDARPNFHHELEQVHEELVRLASAVVELIPRVTAVILDGDLVEADRIVQADDEIDARAIDIEERCYRLLVLQQPMAKDLRRIVAAIKMVADIERSADLCVNICKAARRIYGKTLDPRMRGVLHRMSEQAQVLYRCAVEAYADDDAPLGAAIRDMDDLLDGLQTEFMRTLFESHNAGLTDLQVGVQLALVCRFYERIGDHAVSLGERVRYIVTGWMPEQAGAARHRQAQAAEPDEPQ
ncbi:MAG: phosphate signaling complex protein PhoU [Acidimicrobiales bacterium]